MILNPAHPGAVLRDYLGAMTVAEAATRLGVTRAHLSRIPNGRGRSLGRDVFTSLSSAWHLARLLMKSGMPKPVSCSPPRISWCIFA